MYQENVDPLLNFEHCIIKEELIIPDTDNEDEEGESCNENKDRFFDSNENDTSNRKNATSTLLKVRKSKTETTTAKKFKSHQKVKSNGHGFVTIVEPNTDIAMKNLTKSHCKLCNKKAKVIRRKARCATCNTALTYNCENCEKTYKCYNSLLYHLKAIHIPVTKHLKCSKCSRPFIHQANMTAHEGICGREPIYQCAECPHRAYYKSNLRQHIKEKHIGHVFDCKICKKVFSNQRSLNRHVRCYCGKKRSLQCHHCHHKTYRKDHMIGHLQRVHAEVYGAKFTARSCKYCAVALKTFEHVKLHLRRCKSVPMNVKLVADHPDIDAAVKSLAKAHCGKCKEKRNIIRCKTSCVKCRTQLTYSCKNCGTSYLNWSCLRQHLINHVAT